MLVDVVTRDYSGGVKEKKQKPMVYPQGESKPGVLRDAVAGAMIPSVTVRDAKSHLSALLEWVAGGREVIITSDGKPKARLVPAAMEPERKVFRGMGEFLLSQPIHGGPTADEVIREDRDGRGW
jgi:prevent-host-death family protein